MNESRQVAVSYVVTDVNGNVLFTSTPVMTTLGITSSYTKVDLGNLDTTGYANGTDTITVTVADQSSQPLPTATGQGSLIIGSPVTATVTVNQLDQPTGNPTVTNSLLLTGTDTTIDPLTVDGAATTTPATSVALYSDATHNLAYVCGPNGIDVVDVSNPSDPVDDGTFGASLIHQGGLTVGRVDTIGGQPYLLVGTTVVGIVSGGPPPFTILIFSLATPTSPSLVSETTFQTNGFLSDMVVSSDGNTLLVSVYSYYLAFGFAFEGQNGNVIAIDVSTPSAAVIAGNGTGVLFGSTDPNANTTQFGVTLANSDYAYVASSTNTGYSTQDGEGRVLIVNYSNPADMTYTSVDIPGTYQILTVGVQGNQVLAVGRTGGDDNDDNNGTMTLTVLTMNNNDPSNLTVGPTVDTEGLFGTAAFVNKVSAPARWATACSP